MNSKGHHIVNKKKRQPNACEKIFASGVFGKGLLSKIYKELIHLNNPPSLIKIWTKTWIDIFSKKTDDLQTGEMMLSIIHYEFSSVAQSCPTLFYPTNCSTPGLPVHHQLPEFTQTHVYRVGDAIQPSHPLSCPSSPAPNPSQHQGLFQWVNPSHEVTKVLEFQLQHQSFQWTPRTDPLYDGLVGSPCSPRDSQESSPTPQFKSINSSALSFLHSQALTSIHSSSGNYKSKPQWHTISHISDDYYQKDK